MKANKNMYIQVRFSDKIDIKYLYNLTKHYKRINIDYEDEKPFLMITTTPEEGIEILRILSAHTVFIAEISLSYF